MQVGSKVRVTHNTSHCRGFIGTVTNIWPPNKRTGPQAIKRTKWRGPHGHDRFVVEFKVEGGGKFVHSFARRSLKEHTCQPE